MTKPTRKTPVASPVSSRDMQARIDWLRGFYSPGQLQLKLQEYLAGLPPDLPKQERLARIDALKLMGYGDYNRHKKVED